MHAFNLVLPNQLKTYKIIKKLAIFFLALLLINLAYHHLSTVILYHLINQKKMIITRKHQQLTKLTSIKKNGDDMRAMNTEMTIWLAQRDDIFKKLFSLKITAPVSFCLTSLTLKPHSVLMTGNSPSAAAFTHAVLHTPFMRQFSEISIDTIQEIKPANDVNYVQFQVHGTL